MDETGRAAAGAGGFSSAGTGASSARADGSAGGDATSGEPGAGRDGPAVDPSSLFVWATGTFHAALLVTAMVAALHQSGAAGDLLQGVGTLPGAVVYLYLWMVTLATTRRALRSSGVTPAGGVPNGRNALGTALLWGGVTGLGFFAGVFVVVAGAFFLQGGLDAAYFVGVLLVVGVLVSAVVGSLVGLVFAAFDLALLRATIFVTGGGGRGGSSAEPSE